IPFNTASELNVGDSFTSTDPSGALTFVFTSDDSAQETGWVAEVTCATLSVGDVTLDTNFSYFPNPVKNTLQLNAQSNIQNVSIFNMLGQEVLRTAPNNVNSTVDMSALQTGAYLVKVTINDRTETVRVIKQ